MMKLLSVVVWLVLSLASDPLGAQQSGTDRSVLKIIVIAGEGAINVIQQKSAVAPIVEVRDRNDLPVAGATVTFAISGGKSAAFAGGAQSITVTTNGAGRAAAAALSPLSNGGVQIQVSAAFEGQTAAATIGQTNVMTAAQAGSTAPGGSSGGGLSGPVIGGLLAAAAGGAAVAVKTITNPDNPVATAPSLSMAITTFANGVQFTPCQSPAASCELKLSNNAGSAQLHIEMTGVSTGVEHSLAIDCGGCALNSGGDSQETHPFTNTSTNPKWSSARIGYVPGIRYSRTGAFPLRVTWTTGGALVLSFSTLITVVP